MDRRKFIQTGVAGVAGLSLAHTGLANIRMAVPSDISVDRVKLGKTGLKVSRIAMGTGTKGWNYQSNQTRLGLDNFVKMARHGYVRFAAICRKSPERVAPRETHPDDEDVDVR